MTEAWVTTWTIHACKLLVVHIV